MNIQYTLVIDLFLLGKKACHSDSVVKLEPVVLTAPTLLHSTVSDIVCVCLVVHLKFPLQHIT